MIEMLARSVAIVGWLVAVWCAGIIADMAAPDRYRPWTFGIAVSPMMLGGGISVTSSVRRAS